MKIAPERSPLFVQTWLEECLARFPLTRPPQVQAAHNEHDSPTCHQFHQKVTKGNLGKHSVGLAGDSSKRWNRDSPVHQQTAVHPLHC